MSYMSQDNYDGAPYRYDAGDGGQTALAASSWRNG
jgi:hypothetical protein